MVMSVVEFVLVFDGFPRAKRRRDAISTLQPVVEIRELAALRAERSRLEVVRAIFEHALADWTLNLHDAVDESTRRGA
jgi:hypothetical protein